MLFLNIPLKSTDINCKEMLSTVDDLGRITTIKSPNEIANKFSGYPFTFTNGSGLTVRTTQYPKPNEPINTHFLYDPINQLIEVTDAMGKKTIVEYDKAGRRISVTHQASGKTTFGYDGGGNLITKQTESLRKQGIHTNIRYTYIFNRLDSIIYPNHPENNVRYRYGAPGADFNRVGRLLAIEDGSGRQEFKYGLQGELNEVPMVKA